MKFVSFSLIMSCVFIFLYYLFALILVLRVKKKFFLSNTVPPEQNWFFVRVFQLQAFLTFVIDFLTIGVEIKI